MNIFQKASLKYKPDDIKFLIVGESPPIQEKNLYRFLEREVTPSNIRSLSKIR